VSTTMSQHPRPVAVHGLPVEVQWGYSQAIAAGGLIHLAGQVPRDDEGVAMEGPLEVTFQRPFDLIDSALAQLGGSAEDLVFVQVFMLAEDIAEGAQLMAARLGPFKPASELVVINGLNHPKYRLEVVAIARDPQQEEDAMSMQRFSTGSPLDEIYGRSTAVRVGQLLYVSGQPSVDASGTPLDSEVFSDHYELAFGNFVAAVEACGASAADVVSTVTYVTQSPPAEEFENVARLHREHVGSGPSKPASSLVRVQELSVPGAKVEVTGIAVLAEPAE
jgi:2-iminobutanoate/2-iminopropanoate deaminase